jgi:hypothetical protein
MLREIREYVNQLLHKIYLVAVHHKKRDIRISKDHGSVSNVSRRCVASYILPRSNFVLAKPSLPLALGNSVGYAIVPIDPDF